jgi:hypothetical protein
LEELCVNDENNACLEGHIGPLCENCDTFGTVWGKKYGKYLEYQCEECKNAVSGPILILLNILFLHIYIVYSIYKATIETTKKVNL